MEEKIKIEIKDMYCIARLLKSAIAADGNPFTGCRYCKFSCHTKGEIAPNYDHVTQRISDVTGIKFSYRADEMKDMEIEKSRCGDSDF